MARATVIKVTRKIVGTAVVIMVGTRNMMINTWEDMARTRKKDANHLHRLLFPLHLLLLLLHATPRLLPLPHHLLHQMDYTNGQSAVKKVKKAKGEVIQVAVAVKAVKVAVERKVVVAAARQMAALKLEPERVRLVKAELKLVQVLEVELVQVLEG